MTGLLPNVPTATHFPFSFFSSWTNTSNESMAAVQEIRPLPTIQPGDPFEWCGLFASTWHAALPGAAPAMVGESPGAIKAAATKAAAGTDIHAHQVVRESV
ncbi:hypothetical protein FEK33_18900 [Nocardia asteroides NBRC 15531]|uniref:hypothetical protein n=1 Tax=Nocardia asteroides TaxID=1824 RepID=UPI0011087631|nr:hypothetical protein [Nocardia asteroides]TLF65389.1 hypothetical protein FEK33_18900 [Nocardia asteroides NBRC 15531]